MLLIGSQAYDMNRGPSKDFDYIATPDEVERFKADNAEKIVHIKTNRRGMTIFMMGSLPIEFDISETGQSLLKIIEEHEGLAYYSCDGTWVAYPELLLTLKLSHRYMKNSPHFHKTMNDIRYLRDEKGFAVPDVLKDWLKERIKETYFYKTPSLNQSKEDFFSGDSVPYRYDHDTLHECVKFFKTPAFNLIKKDNAEVYTSKEKFFEVSEEIRLATVVEEAMTLALERACIPNDFKCDPFWAYKTALTKLCQSVSSGYWREYAWEHYHEAIAAYNPNYVDLFHKGLSEGIVKPYKA